MITGIVEILFPKIVYTLAAFAAGFIAGWLF
jgi:hypothetical protein